MTARPEGLAGTRSEQRPGAAGLAPVLLAAVVAGTGAMGAGC